MTDADRTDGGDARLAAWFDRMERRVPAARSAGLRADQDDASARTDSGRRELRDEGAALFRQIQDEYQSLQLAGLPATELREHRDRINTLAARLRRSPGTRELRRVITDERAILRDLQDRNREVPAGGFDVVDVVDDVAMREQPLPASSRADATDAELSEELQRVADELTAVHARVRERLPEADRQRFERRVTRSLDLIEDTGSGTEARRSLTDLYDVLADLRARERELDRHGTEAADPSAEAVDPRDRAAIFRQARARYGELRELLGGGSTEVENFRRQVDSLFGRAQRGNEAERRRVVVDLEAAIQDMERRIREARRAAGERDAG